MLHIAQLERLRLMCLYSFWGARIICSYIGATNKIELFSMSTDSVVRARIDSDTKARATAALEAMGMSVSDAIRLLML